MELGALQSKRIQKIRVNYGSGWACRAISSSILDFWNFLNFANPLIASKTEKKYRLIFGNPEK